jgi:nucleoside-diphosphate-sugar epimerase
LIRVGVLDVARIIAKELDAAVIPSLTEATFQTKVNEPSDYILQLGWKPEISLEDGIKQLIECYMPPDSTR